MMMNDRSDADRITINPAILVGKSVIAGTRIPVYLILNLIANGYDVDQIINDYPNLTHDDVKVVLLYASKVLERPPNKP